MKEGNQGLGQVRSRGDRRIQEEVHDTYKASHKYPEPTVCPDCLAVYHRGRWTWGSQAQGADRERCPACQRIADNVPAGRLEISGPFAEAHREEILNLARNEEALEKKAHPLNRIMGIEKKREGLVLTTTDIHLPRRIGKALQHSYHGKLVVHYGENEGFFRASWER